MINIKLQVQELTTGWGSVKGVNGRILFQVGADGCTLELENTPTGKKIITSNTVTSKDTLSFWFCYHPESQLVVLGTFPIAPIVDHSVILLLTDVSIYDPVLDDVQNIKTEEISPPNVFLSYKFNFDKSYKPLVGNTIIANLVKHSGEVKKLVNVQEKLKESPIGYAYRYIDPENFHVTLLNLLHERMYQPWLEQNELLHWQGDWEKINDLFYERLRFVMEKYAQTRVELRLEAIRYSPHFGAIFVPANEEAANKLEEMKKAFQEASGITPPVFVPLHVTLGYKLYPFMPHVIPLADQLVLQLKNELSTFSFMLDSPFFAVFQDMSGFLPFRGSTYSKR